MFFEGFGNDTGLFEIQTADYPGGKIDGLRSGRSLAVLVTRDFRTSFRAYDLDTHARDRHQEHRESLPCLFSWTSAL
jgi:hypothetical protein